MRREFRFGGSRRTSLKSRVSNYLLHYFIGIYTQRLGIGHSLYDFEKRHKTLQQF
jgi:hypothetical protein